MSFKISTRVARIPSLQRQCLVQHRQNLPTCKPTSSNTSRAFSCTPTQCRGLRSNDRSMTRAAAQQSVTQAPKVTFQEAQRDTAAMADDIGLLQDTTIRAPFRSLPGPWKGAFWSYFWAILRSKATGLYSRSSYNRMKRYSKGILSYLPVDTGNNRQLKTYAKRYYEQIYQAYARGDMQTIRRFCLPSLAADFEQRLLARPANLDVRWAFNEKACAARVVSHRVSALGEENPNTAYRQAVIRLSSKQSLNIKGGKVAKKSRTAMEQPRSTDPSEENMVVEYIVLQKRIVNGIEDSDWNVQGFTEESTPAKMEEDADYWRKTLDAQASAL